MVKIRELTNQQLMEKLEKYIQTYNKLENERQRRLEQFGEIEELLTEDEKAYVAEDPAPVTQIQDEADFVDEMKVSAPNLHVDFSDEELQKIHETCGKEISDAEKLQTITKILDLASLNLKDD